ncbi:transposase [Patescibacteria group bacterium]|nr:transposase [Patescibacteria group bacterium]
MVQYPQGVYFLTGSTFLHFPYFKTEEEKEILLNQIIKLQKEHSIEICAYSIQINHYHLLFKINKENEVALVKKIMNGGTSFVYQKKYKMKYSTMWGTQKTIRIWNQKMYWNVVAYICGNLLKHREIGTFEELKNNIFFSYGYFADKYGEKFIKEGIYKVIDVVEGAEGEVNWQDLKSVKWVRMN